MRSAVPGRPAETCSGESSSATHTIERDESSAGASPARGSGDRMAAVLDEPAPAPSAAGRRRGQPQASHRDAAARLLRLSRRARLLTRRAGGRSFARRGSPLPSPRMKELLEGRRFRFALRPQLGQIALGLAIGLTVLDLMAWFGWAARDTNGFVIAASWVAVATAVVSALATITASVASTDAPDEDRALARPAVLAALATEVLYAGSSGLRLT